MSELFPREIFQKSQKIFEKSRGNFVFIKILPTSKHQNIKTSNIYYTDFPKNITSYFSKGLTQNENSHRNRTNQFLLWRFGY